MNNILIYDIETDGLAIDKSKMIFFGAYSYVDNKYYYLNAMIKSEHDKIQELIQNHNVLIGFNNINFDKPIIENTGIAWNTGGYKHNLDLLQILKLKGRAQIMATPTGEMLSNSIENYRLSTIGEALQFEVAKGEIDYNIFKQKSFKANELQEIYNYLYADIKLTKDLWEYVFDYFECFKDYVSYKDYNNFKHINTSTGSFTYHAICYLTNKPVQWSDIKEQTINDGGSVMDPTTDYAEDVVCFDFSSLYPMIFIQNNLFSSDCKCCKKSDQFKGNDLFELRGSYCKKKQGVIEKTLIGLYLQRKKYKAVNDPRQYAIKIMINSLYGITGSSIFTTIYNTYVSGDCTTIGRACIGKAIDIFNDNGFEVIYSDTDSCFVKLNNKPKKEAQKVADSIVNTLQDDMTFPFDEFDFKIDGHYKRIRLVSKKRYYYITEDDEFKIKGLAPIRADCTRCTREVFDIIKPELIAAEKMVLSEEHIQSILYDLISEDITIASQQFNIKKSIDDYANTTGLHAQISQEFGEGTHILIKNFKLGRVGKDKKYCTPDQARMFLSIDDLDLSKSLNELQPFMEVKE